MLGASKHSQAYRRPRVDDKWPSKRCACTAGCTVLEARVCLISLSVVALWNLRSALLITVVVLDYPFHIYFSHDVGIYYI